MIRERKPAEEGERIMQGGGGVTEDEKMCAHAYVVRGLDSRRFSSKCQPWLFLCGDILGDLTFLTQAVLYF